jgi:outer membrane protein insertion porin family
VIRREFRLAEGDPFIPSASSAPRTASSRSLLPGQAEDEAGAGSRLIAWCSAWTWRSVPRRTPAVGRFLQPRTLPRHLSIRQRNFMGKGQELRASVNYSTYSSRWSLALPSPTCFDRNIAVGADIYRRDLRASTSRSRATATRPTSR